MKTDQHVGLKNKKTNWDFIAGWCFGTWILWLSIQLGISSSQLTLTPSFFRGVSWNHPPDRLSRCFKEILQGVDDTKRLQKGDFAVDFQHETWGSPPFSRKRRSQAERGGGVGLVCPHGLGILRWSYYDHTWSSHSPTPPHCLGSLAGLPGYFFPARIWTSGHLGQKLKSFQVNVRKHDWNSPVQWTRPQVAHDFPNCIWVYLNMLGNPDSIQWWIIFPRFPIKISCIVCYSGSLCSGVGHFPV